MTLGVEPARPGIMEEPPRRTEARILTLPRFWRLLGYGAIMAAGTIGMFSHGLSSGGMEHAPQGDSDPLWAQAHAESYALTLAFTTFVLFQFFNVFNARFETGSAFNRQFFANGKLWFALIGVVGLQVVVVHWGPAQAIFSTVDLNLHDWGLATLTAASVLVLEEARKLAARCFSKRR